MISSTYNSPHWLIVAKCVKCYAPVYHMLRTKTLMISGTYARCETNYANLSWRHPGTNTRAGGSSRSQGLTTPGIAIGQFLSGYSENPRRIPARNSRPKSGRESGRALYPWPGFSTRGRAPCSDSHGRPPKVGAPSNSAAVNP